MTGDDIAAVVLSAVSLITALGTFFKMRHDSGQTARKDEITELRGMFSEQAQTIAELRRQLMIETRYRVALMKYIGTLQMLMRNAGLQVPEMPELKEDDDEPDQDQAKKAKR